MSGHQPHYLPSVQYFAKMVSVDAFVYSDDVRFEPKEWQNRNRVARPGSKSDWLWLTVPVQAKEKGEPICAINTVRTGWVDTHLKTLEYAYHAEPGWEMVRRICEAIEQNAGRTLANLNVVITELCCDMLAIKTQRVRATNLIASCVEDVSEKLARQTEAMGCDVYVAGASGKDYLDRKPFVERGIKTFEFEWWPTDYGAPEGNWSIVDLLARRGEDASRYLGTWTWTALW